MSNSTYQAKASAADLSDGNDATYVTLSTSTTTKATRPLLTADPGLGVPYKLVGIQPYIRVGSGTAGQIGVRLVGTGARQRLPQQKISITTSIATYSLLTLTSWGHGLAFTLADLAALSIEIVNVGAMATTRVYELGVYLVYNRAPTISPGVLTTPVTTTSRVRETFTYSDPESDVQLAYQERIYKRPAGYNILSEHAGGQQTDFELDVDGWANVSNAVLSQSSVRKSSGLYSMRLRASAAANMEVASTAMPFKAEPATEYTAMAKFRAEVSARQCRVKMVFKNTAGTILATTANGTVTDAAADPFVMARIVATSPAKTASGHMGIYVVSGTLNEDHYVDEVAVVEGDVSVWPGPGTLGWPAPDLVTSQFNTGNEEVAALEAAGIEPIRDVVVYTDAVATEYITLAAGVYKRYIRAMDAGSGVWSDWQVCATPSTEDFVMACFKVPSPTLGAVTV